METSLYMMLRGLLNHPKGATITVSNAAGEVIGRWPVARSSRHDSEGIVWMRILPPLDPPMDSLRDSIHDYAVRPHAFREARINSGVLTGTNMEGNETYELHSASDGEREVIDQFERWLAHQPQDVQWQVRDLQTF